MMNRELTKEEVKEALDYIFTKKKLDKVLEELDCYEQWCQIFESIRKEENHTFLYNHLRMNHYGRLDELEFVTHKDYKSYDVGY